MSVCVILRGVCRLFVVQLMWATASRWRSGFSHSRRAPACRRTAPPSSRCSLGLRLRLESGFRLTCSAWGWGSASARDQDRDQRQLLPHNSDTRPAHSSPSPPPSPPPSSSPSCLQPISSLPASSARVRPSLGTTASEALTRPSVRSGRTTRAPCDCKALALEENRADWTSRGCSVLTLAKAGTRIALEHCSHITDHGI